MFLYSVRRLSIVWTVLTIALSGLVLINNAVYFQNGGEPRFFLEKGAVVAMPIWRAAFYFHVVGASICLVTGIPLMFSKLLRYRRLHRNLGYLYLNSVLWMAAPAGLVMAPFAKGGTLGVLGFSLLGMLWWWTTWTGYLSIRRNDLPGHIRGMVRSYSLALSALSFRLFQAGLFYAGLADRSNYIVSLWLSLAASLWLSETCLQRRLPSPYLSSLTTLKRGVLS